jgi:hypothetical protein
MNRTIRLKTLSAAVALGAILPLATPSPSFAQGPGPCTPPGGFAVGAEGPAMSGGQLMAGVGQCRLIGAWHHDDDWRARAWERGPGPYASWDAGSYATGFAAGQGPGPYTPPAGHAVGAAGPAMSGGQLMAGVGQARPIGAWRHHGYARAPAWNWGAGGYATGDVAGNPHYGYEGPNY